ncbi:hypothetical protein PISMIDRAFT_486845 [Pisolithus microcarpus 441]|uniref:Uncharacterized protein n=1 Tax=Pisolithus microcarpus 441 TaxID=765257 RepID=A0A0C9ZJW2_9AGAM|nr:hypothetical protein PISMIDRAFT_486845 [Pisolithus microcarpus 441]
MGVGPAADISRNGPSPQHANVVFGAHRVLISESLCHALTPTSVSPSSSQERRWVTLSMIKLRSSIHGHHLTAIPRICMLYTSSAVARRHAHTAKPQVLTYEQTKRTFFRDLVTLLLILHRIPTRILFRLFRVHPRCLHTVTTAVRNFNNRTRS